MFVAKLNAEVAEVREELAMLPDTAGTRSVCEMYADMEDEMIASATKPTTAVRAALGVAEKIQLAALALELSRRLHERRHTVYVRAFRWLETVRRLRSAYSFHLNHAFSTAASVGSTEEGRGGS